MIIKRNSSKHAPTELGTQPIGSLLWQYALPAIVAMLASSLYNLVDSFFIGQGMGNDAITGMGITAPFMNISVALGSMVGIGSSTVISLRLGQGKYGEAQRFLGNAITLNVAIGVIFMVIGILFLRPILSAFGASDTAMPYAYDYMLIILLGNVITHCYFGLNNILRAAGHPTISMRLTLLTIATNCVLDPLFIFNEIDVYAFCLPGFGWGISGAALATVLSQLISLVIQLRILNNRGEVLHWQRGIFRPRLHIVRQTLTIGMSPFLMHLCSCAVVIFFNNRLKGFGGDDAIGAYSLINRIVFCFLMVGLGLCQGMQPIVGYNWGAQQDGRVWRALRYTIFAATAVSTTGCLVGTFFPTTVVSIFGADNNMLSVAGRGYRIMVIMLPVVGAQMVIGNFFQSIGHAGKSIYMSLTRQMLFLIPCVWLLPKWFGLDGIWMSQPVADGLAFFNAVGILLWLVRRERRKKKLAAAQLGNA